MAPKFANSELKFPNGQAVTFDPEAFDTAIESQGVKFDHMRAMRCPVGMIDRYDSRRPHDDHSGCSNGFLYTKAGTITALFLGNGNNRDPNDIGFLDGSTVQITAPRFYDQDENNVDKPVQIVPFDRLYLAEEAVTVEHWQLVEAHVTGKDKLSFPVIEVVDLIDAKGKSYRDKVDFNVVGGQIVWVASSGPGFDASANRGVVYACRYTYRPYFYCDRVIHQVRVAQVETPLERSVMRMPQQFQLIRENVFEKSDHDPESVNPTDPRQVKAPADGAYGPR